jgi:hypothetical protein
MVFRLKEEIAIGSPVTFIHVVCVEILYPKEFEAFRAIV